MIPFMFSGNFYKTGFTLIELENEPITKDWRTNLQQGNPDLKYFIDDVEPHIKKLYPRRTQRKSYGLIMLSVVGINPEINPKP